MKGVKSMEINRKQFEILVCVAGSETAMTQRELESSTGFSLGTVNKAVNELMEEGLIKDGMITDKGLADENAIAAALRTASDLKETAICALLMESGRQNKKQETGLGLSLELEDW